MLKYPLIFRLLKVELIYIQYIQRPTLLVTIYSLKCLSNEFFSFCVFSFMLKYFSSKDRMAVLRICLAPIFN